MRLIYIGDGSFLPGVPARDLSDEEVAAHGGVRELTASGLYEKPAEDEKRAAPAGKKTGEGES